MKYRIIAPLQGFLAEEFSEDTFPVSLELPNGFRLGRTDLGELTRLHENNREFISDRDYKDLAGTMYSVYYDYDAGESAYSGIPKTVESTLRYLILSLRIVRPSRAYFSILNVQAPQPGVEIPIDFAHKPIPTHFLFDDDITHEAGSPRSQFFVGDDCPKILLYLAIINRLFINYQNKFHRVLNSLIFFEVAHETYFYKARLSNIVTGLESLFNTSNEQVGYSLRNRCSYFLGKSNSKERLILSNKLRDIYSLRSNIVHGQSASKKILADIGLQIEMICEAEDILRACLQRILSDEKLMPVFEANNNSLTKAFDMLVSGSTSVLS